MKQERLVRLVLDMHSQLERMESRIAELEELFPEEGPMARKRKKKADEICLDFTLVNDMSTTEIAQLCQMQGHASASRQLPREDLIALLLGEPIETPDPLEVVRERTYEFTHGNTQIMPSASTCGFECFQCPHNRVVECYTANHRKVTPQ
jgi:hypothetical protein